MSERKTAGREKGVACKHLFRPLPRQPLVNMSKFAGADWREFAGSTSYEQCFPHAMWRSRFHIWAIVSFEDRPVLKELYDMFPDVLGRRFLGFLCLQQIRCIALRVLQTLKGFWVSKSQRNLLQKQN